MLYNIYINQKMCESEGISINAVIIFEVIKQLSNLTYIQKKTHEDRIYTVLYQNMILNQIPFCNIKSRTLTRAVKELKDAELIDTLDSTKCPAYAFTSKSDKYISSIQKPNGGEIVVEKNRKQPLFALARPMKAIELKEDYYKLLRTHSLNVCEQQKIPKEEFDKFFDHHASKGNKFENWLSAFRTWCRNYKKFNANVAESNDRGMYQ